MWSIQLWKLGRVCLEPLTSLLGVEGSSLPDSAPPDDTVDSDSVVDVKPGHSGVMIKYQVDEFTHT